jgi:membrane-associated phospholipid phosphatase
MPPAVACVVLVVVGAVTTTVSAVVAARGVPPAEADVFRRVNDVTDAPHRFIALAMQFGTYGTTPVLAAVLWLSGRHEPAAMVLLAGSAAWLGAKALKPVAHRARPAAALAGARVRVRGPAQWGRGFPSGHAATAASLALTLGAALGGWWWIPLVALAIGTGYARIYVGAHLPLDVLGGWGIGVATGSAAILVARTVV